jgi:hypothetical protein
MCLKKDPIVGFLRSYAPYGGFCHESISHVKAGKPGREFDIVEVVVVGELMSHT